MQTRGKFPRTARNSTKQRAPILGCVGNHAIALEKKRPILHRRQRKPSFPASATSCGIEDDKRGTLGATNLYAATTSDGRWYRRGLERCKIDVEARAWEILISKAPAPIFEVTRALRSRVVALLGADSTNLVVYGQIHHCNFAPFLAVIADVRLGAADDVELAHCAAPRVHRGGTTVAGDGAACRRDVDLSPAARAWFLVRWNGPMHRILVVQRAFTPSLFREAICVLLTRNAILLPLGVLTEGDVQHPALPMLDATVIVPGEGG
jgi:hypothetical protein